MSFKIRNQKVPDVYDTITVTAGNLTNTKTHTNKTFANCRLRLLGFHDDNDGSGTFPYIELSQSGADVVVTVTRVAAFTSNIIVRYAIEEYVNHVIRNVERFILSASTGAPVIHTVTQTGAYYSLALLGFVTSDNASGNIQNWCMDIQYDGVTTVTGTPGANGILATMKTSIELTDWY